MLISEDVLWMVIVGFIVAFVLAFGIGANDVANSFGTSVGSKVLTLRQACILGSIFEMLGAILIGYRVSDTIRKGIIDVSLYNNGSEELLMVGNVAALSGSCVWLLLATFLKLPVSTTHSIVGATLGFALVAHGLHGINWKKLGLIVGSWFISPVMSGVITICTFLVINFLVLKRDNSFEVGLKLLPIFYALTAGINAFSVFYKGSNLLHFNEIPLYGVFILTFGIALIVGILIFFFVPFYKKRVLENLKEDEDNASLQEAPEGPVPTLAAEMTEFEVTNEGHKMLPTDPMVGDCDKENIEKRLEEGVALNEKTPLKDRIILGEKDTNVDCLHTPNIKDSPPSKDASPQEGSVTPLLFRESPSQFSSQRKMLTDTSYEGSPDSSQQSSTSDLESQEEKRLKARQHVVDEPKTAKLFSFLQIMTAVFGSFAHGGNDVSNAIGPLVSIWIIGTEGSALQKAETPIWILIFGGVGISIGLWVWGRRVIKTMGEDLTKITPSSGFCIEIGSALTVLIASNIGIPISTTHCKVGSVVAVGRVRSRENVDWKLFRNIVFAWLVTLPIAGGVSAALMAIFKECL